MNVSQTVKACDSHVPNSRYRATAVELSSCLCPPVPQIAVAAKLLLRSTNALGYVHNLGALKTSYKCALRVFPPGSKPDMPGMLMSASRGYDCEPLSWDGRA
jgi:hypothetical protein